eukprot:scaffold6544_cov112-Cylindrotheca_fusiformis.AAC.4
MATANAVIVIDDGDDETENDESDSALKQKEEKIIALSEILHVSREQSKSALEGCGYDLQQAILAKLDHNLSRRTTKSLSIPAAVKTMVQRPLKTSLPVHAPAKLADPQGELSPQWQSCYQNSPTPFVDPQFTPTKTSLDGRRTAAGQSSKKDVVVLCHCQLPATSRTVQSDGPNYGRFFLVCGRPRSTNRGRRRRNDEQSDNNGNSSQTTAKNKPCNFFQWDKNGSLGGGYAATRWSHISWHLFAGTEYVVCRKKMGPEQIRQGAVGNCWFLSALAVVAEKEYLIRRVFPHTTTNEKGCYQVNLCLDGKWTSVMVDAHLPVVLEENDATTGKPTTTRSLQKQDFRGVALQNGQLAFPAFCAVPRGQLWPALVEKAYAKTHGSYANLSGGFIAEGLADLTGAPHETILFEMKDDRDSRDELWARLLSFFEAGFLMGVATSKGGDGLVGSHAYSILKVREIHGSVIGSQQKVTDFFAGISSKKAKLENGTSRTNPRKETIRLLSIRNPWGKKGKICIVTFSSSVVAHFHSPTKAFAFTRLSFKSGKGPSVQTVKLGRSDYEMSWGKNGPRATERFGCSMMTFCLDFTTWTSARRERYDGQAKGYCCHELPNRLAACCFRAGYIHPMMEAFGMHPISSNPPILHTHFEPTDRRGRFCLWFSQRNEQIHLRGIGIATFP